ncbi:hypothetical protein [Geoanaerobacter pelophilus]|nr:hypothetical protein [Geoanaerobacter pelophilus]
MAQPKPSTGNVNCNWARSSDYGYTAGRLLAGVVGCSVANGMY